MIGEFMDVKSVNWEDIDLAPEEPGIYSWYLDPVLRQADLVDSQSTKENLLRLAEQLMLPSFELEARGHLSLRFQGNLDHVHLASENSGGLSQLVESILNDDLKRDAFAKILGTAAPHLMAPLYIGVATNIRQRLRQHRYDIERYRELQRTGLKDSVIEDAKQKFALEIVKRGIPSRRLRVFISSTFEIQNNENVRETAEAVETILNRLFYPIMGRR